MFGFIEVMPRPGRLPFLLGLRARFSQRRPATPRLVQDGPEDWATNGSP